uniref:Hypothetical chloroplast RF21 n=1 Tax=Megaloselaginella exaltata TaxID=3140882 RepID=A0A7T8G037_9TRAC|nr:hypothetical chloroplast RF21 [Selaginella exaltata]
MNKGYVESKREPTGVSRRDRGNPRRRPWSRVSEWALGPLIATPRNSGRQVSKFSRNLRLLTLGFGLPRQFLVPSSPSPLLALPIWKDLSHNRGNKNRPPLPEAVLMVRSNCGRGLERWTSDKHFHYLEISTIGRCTHTELVVPTGGNVVESRGNEQIRYAAPFTESGRSGNWVFEIWNIWGDRNIRSNPHTFLPGTVGLVTAPREKCPGKEAYNMTTFTNRYKCLLLPLRSAPPAVDNDEFTNRYPAEAEPLVALLDRMKPVGPFKNRSTDGFPHKTSVGPAYDISSDNFGSISVFGNQTRSRKNLPIIMKTTRTPLCTSLVGGIAEEYLATVAREELRVATCNREECYEDLFHPMIAGRGLDGATNLNQPSQHGINRIRLVCLHKLIHLPWWFWVKTVFCHKGTNKPRTPFFAGYAASGLPAFRAGINQPRWKRRAANGANKVWGSQSPFRDYGYIQVDRDSAYLYPWSIYYDEDPPATVLARNWRRDFSMGHNRTRGITTGHGPFGRSAEGFMRNRELHFIRERLSFRIRDLAQSQSAGYPAAGAGKAKAPVTHTGTKGVTSGYRRRYKPWWNGSSCSSPYAAKIDGFTADPYSNIRGVKLGDDSVRAASSLVSAHAIPGLRKRCGPAIGNSSGVCPCVKNPTPYSLRIGRGKGRTPLRTCNICANHGARVQSRNILLPGNILRTLQRAQLKLRGTKKTILATRSHACTRVYSDHSGGHAQQYVPAHESYKLFDLLARTTSRVLFGTNTGTILNISIIGVKPPSGKLQPKFELALCGPRRVRAQVVTNTVERQSTCCPQSDGCPSSFPVPSEIHPRRDSSGPHNRTNYRLNRIDESLSPSGNGVITNERPGFYGDGTTIWSTPYHNDTGGEPVDAGPERPAVPPRIAPALLKLSWERTLRFLTAERLSCYTVIGAWPKRLRLGSNDRPNKRSRRVRILLDQILGRSAREWVLGDDSDNKYFTVGALLTLSVIARGSDYIDLWIRLEIVRFRVYSLHKYLLDGTTKTRRHYTNVGQIGFMPNLKHFFKRGGSFLPLGGITFERLYDKGLDIYPPTRLLKTKVLATDENNSRHESGSVHNHHLFNNACDFRAGGRPYNLRRLTSSYGKNMLKYLLNHPASRTHVSSALWQRITPLNETSGTPPATLQSGFSSEGILSVGSAGTGRSYLMNDLSADFDAPSVPLPMSDLYETERFITIKDAKTNGMKRLATSLCRLMILVRLLGKMLPRVIWIRKMHELDFKGAKNLAQADIGTHSSLCAFLLFLTCPALYAKSMLVTGSTHTPREIDPSLICSNRLGRLLNVRMHSVSRRQNKCPVILRSRRFYLVGNKDSACLNAFRYRILCDYARDLASLTSEALLISLSQLSTPRGDAAGSVLLGKVVHKYDDIRLDTANLSDHVFRAGKAFAHSIVIGLIVTSISCCESRDKDRPIPFGHASYTPERYELSVAETAVRVREFAILSRVLRCSAGSAINYRVAETRRYASISPPRSSKYDHTSARAALATNTAAEQWLEMHEGNLTECDQKRWSARSPAGTTLGPPSHEAIAACLLFAAGGAKYGMTEYITLVTRAKGVGDTYYDFAKTTPAPVARTHDPLQSTGSDYDHNAFINLPVYDYDSRISPQGLHKRARQGRYQSGVPFTYRFINSGISIPRVGRFYMAEYQQLPSNPVVFKGKRFVWDPACLSSARQLALPLSEDSLMGRGSPILVIGTVCGNRIVFEGGTHQQIAYLNEDMSMANANLSKPFADVSHSEFASALTVGTNKRTKVSCNWSMHIHSFYPTLLSQAWFAESSTRGARQGFKNQQQRGPTRSSSPLEDACIYSILSESHQFLLEKVSANVALLNRVNNVIDIFIN